MITGKQTVITPYVKTLVTTITGENEKYLYNCLYLLKSFKKINSDSPDFSRTAEEILQSKHLNGCHESGIAFAALIRAKDVPVRYIQALNKTGVERYESGYFKGHVFCRVNLAGKEYIIDPMNGTIDATSKLKKMIIGGEGLDSWDIGLKNGFPDLKKMFKRKHLEYVLKL